MYPSMYVYLDLYVSIFVSTSIRPMQGIDEESQLILTSSQLECLVDCILKEAAATCVGMKGLTDSSSLEKGLEV